MEESLMKSIEAIGGFFHLYVITFATYGIIGIIRFLNNKYYRESSPIKFLDMNIYPEYFSLIYGILFFASMVVIHLMFLNIQTLIAHSFSKSEDVSVVKMLLYCSWIGSPFSIGKLGLTIFTSMISVGILYALYLAAGHLLFSMPKDCKIPEWLYRTIGGFDLMVFIMSIYWFFIWKGFIISIRSKLGV